MGRPDIPWNHGVDDDAWGTHVWIARVENLAAHLRILRAHIPEGPMHDWLINQTNAGLAEAAEYVREAKPSDDTTPTTPKDGGTE